MDGYKKKIVYVTNVDWFFISHRLPLAIHAIENGYEVYLLCCDTGHKEKITKRGIKFINIPFERSGRNPFHELKCIFLLIKNYLKIQPDIIHHITLKAALLGTLAAKITRKKRIVNAISGFGYNFTDGRNGFTQRIIKILIILIFKDKDISLILQNPDDVQMIRDLKIMKDANIHLIKGSGVDLNKYLFTEEPTDGLIRILFPARILIDKGVREFISAAKKMQKDYQGKAIFILAGNCDADNLAVFPEDKLKSVLIPSYVEWIGYQEDMLPIFIKSHIVVLPSYREGLPKALIEACAIGRAIITTDVPGCRECVIDGFNGYLVPAKDTNSLIMALKKLIDDKNIRKDFGKNSRKLAEENFSIISVIDQTFSIYNSFLNN